MGGVCCKEENDEEANAARRHADLSLGARCKGVTTGPVRVCVSLCVHAGEVAGIKGANRDETSGRKVVGKNVQDDILSG